VQLLATVRTCGLPPDRIWSWMLPGFGRQSVSSSSVYKLQLAAGMVGSVGIPLRRSDGESNDGWRCSGTDWPKPTSVCTVGRCRWFEGVVGWLELAITCKHRVFPNPSGVGGGRLDGCSSAPTVRQTRIGATRLFAYIPLTSGSEVKLPLVLSHLSNRPYGRYRFSCPVKFSYRSTEWYAQVETGAVRYDVFYDPDRLRWYIDASWTHAPRELPRVEGVTANGVVAVDVNSDHLACWVIQSDGNPSGRPHTIPITPASPKSSTRDGHIRHVVHQIISLAQTHGCHAIAIENLNFNDLKAGGREVHGRGARGKQRLRMITTMPTRQFRARLVQMCANKGLWVVAVDPAYTSKWGRQHWLGPLNERTRTTASIHHAAAVVIGRRAVGHRARRRSHVPAGDRRIAHAESCGSGRARSDGVQEPDHPRPDPAAPERRIRQASASGAAQGPGHPGPFGATQRRLDWRRR